MKYYLTRDSMHDGTLSPAVSVWSSKPERTRVAGGYSWHTPGMRGLLSDYLTSYFLQDCLKEYGVYPDDDKQLIVVERSE